MTEEEIRRHVFDLSLEIANYWDNPTFNTVGLILDHFNRIPNNMLYRYRSCNENEFIVLEKKSIYLSKASHFKDKLDCKVHFDFENISEKEKIKLVKSCMLADYSNAYIEFNDNAKCEMPIPKAVKDFINKCYDKDFNLIKKKLVKYVKRKYSYNTEYFLKKFNELDKIFTKGLRGEQLIEGIVERQKGSALKRTKQIQDESFICSFTELYSNLSMWENYADNYSGFCVGYELKGVNIDYLHNPLIRACMMQIFPAIYNDKKPKYSGYSLLIQQNEDLYKKAMNKNYKEFDYLWCYYIMIAMLYKNENYSWEKEWRIVLSNLDEQIVFFPFAIRLYLGKDIEEKNKERLMKIAKKNNLSVYQQRLDDVQGEYVYELVIPRVNFQKVEVRDSVVPANLSLW